MNHRAPSVAVASAACLVGWAFLGWACLLLRPDAAGTVPRACAAVVPPAEAPLPPPPSRGEARGEGEVRTTRCACPVANGATGAPASAPLYGGSSRICFYDEVAPDGMRRRNQPHGDR